MNRRHDGAVYTSTLVHDTSEGFAALELTRTTAGKEVLVARLVFWDAMGQFFLETVGTDVPLNVVEELIAEAKATIVTS